MQIFFNPRGLVDFTNETRAFLQEALPFASFTFAPLRNYNAEIMVGYPQQIMSEDLSLYPRLKAIHLLSSGYDELDLELLKGRGIRLFNAKATNATAISEFVIGQILSTNYNFLTYRELQNQKIWKRRLTSRELNGSRALILGVGAIGETLALKLTALGVEVYGYRKRNIKSAGFKKITTSLNVVYDQLASFDYVIVALPLSAETINLINRQWFEKMKESALLINVARGGIVDEEALVVALQAGQIRGAILDVTKKEPLPIDSPLWEAPNLIITPHVAFYNDKYLDNVLRLLLHNLDAYKNNKPIETEIIL